MTNTMPLYIFGRRHDIEIESGLILAGQLIFDLPKKKKLKQRDRELIASVIGKLTAEAQSGQMPHDAIVCGWREGGRPANAAEIEDGFMRDDDVVISWLKTRVVIGVRIDPRNDGMLRIDSDMRRQMGCWIRRRKRRSRQ
jgi:hypothetical protein